MGKWIRIGERVPDKNTRYAKEYGVGVLAFDENEFISSGYCDPFEVSYSFENKEFQTLAYGQDGTEWVEAVGITHWRPIPDIPEEYSEKS